MKRQPNTCSQTSAAAMLSAGVLLVSGASVAAQAPKPASGQKAPVATAATAPTPQPAANAKAESIFIKWAGTFHKYGSTLRVAGTMNGSPVFMTDKGEFFQVDVQTGDLKFHSPAALGLAKEDDWERKGGKGAAPAAAPAAKPAGGSGLPFIKWNYIKLENRVSVLGVDAQGHVIQQNSRGERFYLGPNGDMVFVK